MRKIFLLLFILMTVNTFSASQLLHTVKQSGGDFTSLDACLDHLESEHSDLVSDDVYADIEIDGSWSSDDTSSVIVQNITTNATHYINIYTTSTARHDGKRYGSKTTAYRLKAGACTVNALKITDLYVTIDGLQIKGNGGTYTSVVNCSAGKVNIGSGESIIKNCIITNAKASNAGTGIGASNNSVTAINNLIHDIQSNCIDCYMYDSGTCAYIANNTVINGAKGISLSWGNGRTKTFYNNLSFENDTADFSISNTSDWGTNADNMSGDGTAPADATEYVYADQFVSTTSGSEDFHLKSGADAIDAGTSCSGTFTDDIDGDTRSGSWDVGCDEIVTATTSNSQIIIITS